MKPMRVAIHRTLDIWLQEERPFWQGDPKEDPLTDVITWVRKQRKILKYVEQWMAVQQKEERRMKRDADAAV
jgi:hypothetical protein